ncbi:diaminopimelate epimerase [Methanolinea mesophila]|uniref:diaminopimelate epimerase n=1 Tax=Methanolinea mesophila TaxID=547055 RepID=UPI001AE1440D|nr:diaminopimelate epimerase [Methanolinea mesophila]MBP1928761.1 diaminopimelate epimerase [Methanolinea mesophila]
MEIDFTKLQGNGNDFILVDEYKGTVIPDEMKSQFARLFCDRRFGIGGDGVLFLTPSERADLGMRLFQEDESEAEMCGNGIRCFAKYAFDQGYVKEKCRVETLAGVIGVEMAYEEDTFMAVISMPDPKFDRKDIPATGEGEYLENVLGYDVRAVNTGVPHAIVFAEDVDAVDLEGLAPSIRNHASFPKGANVNFVQITGKNSLKIRTFERGIEGETLSCGTGATAAAAMAHKLGMVGDEVDVETPGGNLVISLGKETRMKGPAVTVFSGSIPF